MAQVVPAGVEVVTPIAAVTFNKPQVQMGQLVMPPGAVKTDETATSYEAFVVVSCENKAFELVLNGAATELCSNSHIMIPSGVVYSFHNKSRTTEAVLTYFLLG